MVAPRSPKLLSRDVKWRSTSTRGPLANPRSSWRRMIGSMFMRVNSKCAHQGAPTTAGAAAHDLGGIPESNCGGRSTGRATIEALPQVVAEVGDRIPVFVDGGAARHRRVQGAGAPHKSGRH